VIQTPVIDSGFEETRPGFEEALLAKHPIGRLGAPRDIAESVAWHGSDAASFATGSLFNIAGGYLAIYRPRSDRLGPWDPYSLEWLAKPTHKGRRLLGTTPLGAPRPGNQTRIR